MENDKTIESLNILLEINNDRVNSYETASNETDENDLKTLFSLLAETSIRCRQELEDEIKSLNGEPVSGTNIRGMFFPSWIEVKAALSGKDRNAIISLCEFGEDKVIETYKKVLMDDILYLSTRQMTLIRLQYAHLKADNLKIHSLRAIFIYKPEGPENTEGRRAFL